MITVIGALLTYEQQDGLDDLVLVRLEILGLPSQGGFPIQRLHNIRLEAISLGRHDFRLQEQEWGTRDS